MSKQPRARPGEFPHHYYPDRRQVELALPERIPRSPPKDLEPSQPAPGPLPDHSFELDGNTHNQHVRARHD
jgi:hypothetical protein